MMDLMGLTELKRELALLGDDEQRELIAYLSHQQTLKEERRETLKASAGLLSKNEGEEWLEAIKDCGRADLGSW